MNKHLWHFPSILSTIISSPPPLAKYTNISRGHVVKTDLAI